MGGCSGTDGAASVPTPIRLCCFGGAPGFFNSYAQFPAGINSGTVKSLDIMNLRILKSLGFSEKNVIGGDAFAKDVATCCSGTQALTLPSGPGVVFVGTTGLAIPLLLISRATWFTMTT